jgi:hypothetical protein
MAVSQEMDQNYGLFKNQFQKNIDEVIDVRIKGNYSTSIAPHLAAGWTDNVWRHGSDQRARGENVRVPKGILKGGFLKCLGKGWSGTVENKMLGRSKG